MRNCHDIRQLSELFTWIWWKNWNFEIFFLDFLMKILRNFSYKKVKKSKNSNKFFFFTFLPVVTASNITSIRFIKSLDYFVISFRSPHPLLCIHTLISYPFSRRGLFLSLKFFMCLAKHFFPAHMWAWMKDKRKKI